MKMEFRDEIAILSTNIATFCPAYLLNLQHNCRDNVKI